MIIYYSKALQEALKIAKSDIAIPEQLENEENLLYAWHGHITKVDGRNTIVLMNDKTMYSILFRNKLPRNSLKFAELIKEAVPYVLEVGNVNREEITKYKDNIGDIFFADKPDRQITGNMNRMILDMSYQWEYEWRDDETIQAYESWKQNRLLRKIGKDYVVPFEEMLRNLCE